MRHRSDCGIGARLIADSRALLIMVGLTQSSYQEYTRAWRGQVKVICHICQYSKSST